MCVAFNTEGNSTVTAVLDVKGTETWLLLSVSSSTTHCIQLSVNEGWTEPLLVNEMSTFLHGDFMTYTLCFLLRPYKNSASTSGCADRQWEHSSVEVPAGV